MPDTGQTSHSSVVKDPRTFVRGAGFIFQAVGLIFLLGGCCLGSFSGLVQGRIDVVPANFSQWFTQSPPGQVIAAINILTTVLAGLGLMVFGIGLQHERLSSATASVVTTALLAACWCGTSIAAILLAPSILRIALTLLFSGVSIWLLLMALAARRELRLHPPTQVDEPVTPEFLAQFETSRRIEQELDGDSIADKE
jgi:hypothetical protein